MAVLVQPRINGVLTRLSGTKKTLSL